MAGQVETTMRGPQAYDMAKRAIEVMQSYGIWPTPLNFELWLHFVGDPESPLGKEIQRLIGAGEPITETVSEELAATFLPKAKLNDQIHDASDQLSQELTAVAKAMDAAQRSSTDYGETLAEVSTQLAAPEATSNVEGIVETLSSATKQVQKENKLLEAQLKDSTAEVNRLREHLEQVRRDATTDGLTNLANRKAFDEELARACAEAETRGEPLALAVLDIDHFKSFNDTWGHQTGDQVLRYVASVIGRLSAPPRFAARYGGEEFSVIFPAEAGPVVFQTLEKIREEVASRVLKRRSTGEDLGAVTISAGYAERMAGETLHSLVDRADSALYTSKRSGRNRVTAAIRKAEAEAA